MRTKNSLAEFTSLKLDWLTAIQSDKHISQSSFFFAYYVARHLNKDSGKAYFSDETAMDEIHMSRSTLGRCRKELKEHGYLKYVPGRVFVATLYTPVHDRVSDWLDILTIKKDRRNEAREARKVEREDDLRRAAEREKYRRPNAA